MQTNKEKKIINEMNYSPNADINYLLGSADGKL